VGSFIKILQSLPPKQYVAELDNKCAFQQLPCGPESCYLAAQIDDSVYRFERLTFGLKSSPLLWAKLASTVYRTQKRILRIRGTLYVDDKSVPVGECVEKAFKGLVGLLLIELAMGLEVEMNKLRMSKTPQVLKVKIHRCSNCLT
jgi:hypothetical protein